MLAKAVRASRHSSMVHRGSVVICMHVTCKMSVQALLENAREYIRILKASRTDQVAKWKATDLNRAVDWALHFEKVTHDQEFEKVEIQWVYCFHRLCLGACKVEQAQRGRAWKV